MDIFISSALVSMYVFKHHKYLEKSHIVTVCIIFHHDHGLWYYFYHTCLSIAWTGPCSAVGNMSCNDARLSADPGVASSIPAQSHTFMEIDYEIISAVIRLPSTESFKKDCCQL